MPRAPSTINVLALVSDLIFESKIRAAARGTGLAVNVVRTTEDLLSLAQQQVQHLIFVDLNALGADVEATLGRLRDLDSAVQIVGFASHVDAALMNRAKAAGATEVMPRSQFAANLTELVGELGQQAGDPG